jgi:hypothetical protein
MGLRSALKQNQEWRQSCSPSLEGSTSVYWLSYEVGLKNRSAISARRPGRRLGAVRQESRAQPIATQY